MNTGGDELFSNPLTYFRAVKELRWIRQRSCSVQELCKNINKMSTVPLTKPITAYFHHKIYPISNGPRSSTYDSYGLVTEHPSWVPRPNSEAASIIPREHNFWGTCMFEGPFIDKVNVYMYTTLECL
ncbi:hypothetical protein QTP88_014402 [Uroleucon formosanum]